MLSLKRRRKNISLEEKIAILEKMAKDSKEGEILYKKTIKNNKAFILSRKDK